MLSARTHKSNEALPQTDEVYPYPKSCGYRLMSMGSGRACRDMPWL